MSGQAVRVLLLGDVCAETGRKAIAQALPGLRARLGLDFVIANGENAAGGYGITPKLAEELFRAGVDCLTTGDHVFDRKEVWEYLGAERRILRPLNYPPDAPGRGYAIYEVGRQNAEGRGQSDADGEKVRVAVVNLVGRVFMKSLDCPFRRVMPVVNELGTQTPIVVVDVHAEATAEKIALGWFLDGRVSAVLGTHTHIQTADERVLPGGTAYITDAGMCGAFDSVLGMDKGLSLRRLVDMVPVRLHPATGDVRLNGVVVDIEPSSGRALGITRLSEAVEPAANQPPAATSLT